MAERENGISLLNRNMLKLIAFVSMVIDHASYCFLRPPIRALVRGSAGRIAFPLFCWLFFLGFFRVRSYGKHLLLLAGSAVMAEFFYDYVFYGVQTYKYIGDQNVMCSWLLGFLMLMVLSKLESLPAADLVLAVTMDVGIIFTFAVLCTVCHTDYEFIVPLALGACYLLRKYLFHQDDSIVNQKTYGLVIACVTAVCSSPGALLALPFIVLYSDVPCRNKYKYLYYFGYPGHLALLSAILFLKGVFHS